MRYLSAFSSGQTGVFIAQEMSGNHRVTLLGSPEACLRAQPPVETAEFGATRDLMTRMEEWIRSHRGSVVVHAAAVGDYEATPEPHKISSGLPELVIRLQRAPKIADHIKDWDPTCSLVTFKAAGPSTDAGQLVAIARSQLRRTGSDWVFGNVIGALESTCVIVDIHGSEAFDSRGDALLALAARLGG
jgi:phosphopantothenoylcysteine synthetase/decarboxylase